MGVYSAIFITHLKNIIFDKSNLLYEPVLPPLHECSPYRVSDHVKLSFKSLSHSLYRKPFNNDFLSLLVFKFSIITL